MFLFHRISSYVSNNNVLRCEHLLYFKVLNGGVGSITFVSLMPFSGNVIYILGRNEFKYLQNEEEDNNTM